MAVVSIPKKFYDDHADRELPSPPVISETARHYRIDPAHPDLEELVSDAQHYAGDGTDAEQWIVAAARALLEALKRQDCLPDAAPAGP